MVTLLLVIIYLAFISLGLPDAILGSSWAVIHQDLGVGIDWQGLVSMTISGGTIISSFLSGYLIKKFKTGPLTFISTLLTAVAIIGMAFTRSFFWFWLFAIPLGLGAGAIDTALNNYVALNYKSRHMNWLHSFWGIGALTGPFIMSFFLNGSSSWRKGYLTIFFSQLVLTVILLISLPLWNEVEKMTPKTENENHGNKSRSIRLTIDFKVISVLVIFMFYSAAELAMNAWGSVYLINTHNFSGRYAARTVSIFFIGITIGRFLVGFISNKLGNIRLIRFGQIVALIGSLLMISSLSNLVVITGFLLVGLGCAPIYPAMIHETPRRFGKDLSQRLIGFQMGFAYIGGTFIPPLLGVIAKRTSFKWIPYYVLGFVVIMLVFSELLNLKIKREKKYDGGN